MEPALQRPELMPGKPGRLVLGIAASIVAHAILLLAYRIESLPGITAEDVPPVESLVILVKPKPPELPPATRAEPVTKPAASRAVARANTIDEEEQQDTEVAETVIAVEPTSLPDPFYMPQAPKEKRFEWTPPARLPAGLRPRPTRRAQACLSPSSTRSVIGSSPS